MKKLSELPRIMYYLAFQDCDFLRDRLAEIVKGKCEDDIESEIMLLDSAVDDYCFRFSDRRNSYITPKSYREFVDTLRDHRDRFWYVAHYIDDIDEDILECISESEVTDLYNWIGSRIVSDIIRNMNFRMDCVEHAFMFFNADFRSYVDKYGHGTGFDDFYVIGEDIYEMHKIGSFA